MVEILQLGSSYSKLAQTQKDCLTSKLSILDDADFSTSKGKPTTGSGYISNDSSVPQQSKGCKLLYLEEILQFNNQLPLLKGQIILYINIMLDQYGTS